MTTKVAGWVEQPLTDEQRVSNWMWMSAVNWASSAGRDRAGDGLPPAEPVPAPIPGDQWFDLNTGRAWVWRAG